MGLMSHDRPSRSQQLSSGCDTQDPHRHGESAAALAIGAIRFFYHDPLYNSRNKEKAMRLFILPCGVNIHDTPLSLDNCL